MEFEELVPEKKKRREEASSVVATPVSCPRCDPANLLLIGLPLSVLKFYSFLLLLFLLLSFLLPLRPALDARIRHIEVVSVSAFNAHPLR